MKTRAVSSLFFPEQRTAIMRKLGVVVARFARAETGATMVEYGVMVALIATVCFVIVATMGTTVQGLFTTVASAWAAA
jgi:pilus assembly protein Flp/PilA